jgi:hypothetical protein
VTLISGSTRAAFANEVGVNYGEGERSIDPRFLVGGLDTHYRFVRYRPRLRLRSQVQPHEHVTSVASGWQDVFEPAGFE